MPPRTIRLESETRIVEIIPLYGGSISAFRDRSNDEMFDWFRPAENNALEHHDPLKLACFPLVPYSNLIRSGRFSVNGRQIQLPLNVPGFPHCSHGDGWLRPWQVSKLNDSSAEIYYRHYEADNPYIYTTRQFLELDGNLLRIRLSVCNEAGISLPYGLGLHPYFSNVDKAVLTTTCTEVWEVDKEFLPLGRTDIHTRRDFSRGMPLGNSNLNHHFGGWCRQAVIEWPEYGRRLTMSASDILDHLVVYTPESEDYFCVEPVSHTVDAFNLAEQGEADIGYRLLEPDDVLEANVSFLTEEIDGKP